MNKMKIKKICKIVTDVILYLFIAICLFSVVLTIFSKKDADGSAEIFGYQMRVVVSDSMAKSEFTDVSDFKIKSIPIRSMIFVKVMPTDPAEADEWYRSLKVGDVLTFRYVYTTQETITHRIISINEKPTGGFVIELAGDNKLSEDGLLSQTIDTSIPNNMNYVIGKVTGKAYLLGVVMSFLMQPVGIILAIIIPCLIIVILEVIKITMVLTAEKRQKEKAAREKQELELDELRRKIAELEQLKAQEPSSVDSVEDNK